MEAKHDSKFAGHMGIFKIMEDCKKILVA